MKMNCHKNLVLPFKLMYSEKLHKLNMNENIAMKIACVQRSSFSSRLEHRSPLVAIGGHR